MFSSMSRSLSRMSGSAQSVGSPTSCVSAGFAARQEPCKRSGREWWLFAIREGESEREYFYSCSFQTFLGSIFGIVY